MNYELLSLVLLLIPFAVAVVARMIDQDREFAKAINEYQGMKVRALDLNRRMEQDIKDINALLNKHPH
jgi:uncharacterized protein YqgC (DUF456 family)